MEDDEEEPDRLHRLVEGLGRALCDIFAVRRHGLHLPAPCLLLFLCRQLRHAPAVPAHERPGSFHHQHYAFIKCPLLSGCRLHPLPRFLLETGRTFRQPFSAVGADMPLGMILLVDLDHLGDLVDLLAVAAVQHILQGLSFPVGADHLTEIADILLTHLESVLGSGGECLKLPVHPGTAALREDHPIAHSGSAVAHDQLLRLHRDLHLL